MKSYYATLILLLTFYSSLAQNNEPVKRREIKKKLPRTTSISVGAQAVRPLEDFAATYSGNPLGISANIAIPIKKASPFEYGVAFAWNNMGTFDQDIEVVAPIVNPGDTVRNPGTYRARNNNYRYLAQFRFRPFNGAIQPYFDLLGGFENFQTKTDITIQNSGGFSSVEDAKLIQQGGSFLYAYGFGVRIKMGKSQNLFFDLRYEKIDGGKSEYVIPESVHLDQNNAISYNIGNTSTKRDLFQLGMALRF